MDNKLKKYKKLIKYSLIMTIVFFCYGVVVLILQLNNILIPKFGGLFSGCIGGGFGSLTTYLLNKASLKNPQKVSDTLTNEYDERRMAVQKSAASATLLSLAFLFVLAFFVLGYVSETAVYALFGIGVLGCLLYGGWYIYYGKKY